MKTALIVEDEIKLAHVIADYLHHAQFSTHMLHDGEAVVDWVKNNHVDIVLLDLMLPNKDGITICKEIRTFSNVPIIIITAKIDEIDRLLGLEIGADDYICKPFSTREVVARVKTLMRRLKWHDNPSQNTGFKLDDTRLAVSIDDHTIELTAIEFQMLKALMAHKGHILSRQQLIDKSYTDYRIVSDRTVDSHIKKLRKKLNNAASDKEYIRSVYGVGYKFEEPMG